MVKSLWGEEFDIISEKEKSKDILQKLNSQEDIEKAIKSKKTDLQVKISLITDQVYKVLGHYRDNTIVIKTRDQFHSYIDKAIENGIIAIDTETNNSLDPLTCKLMGGCIYTPGEKNAYIPINHTTLQGDRLYWQLTEQDIKEEFERVSNIKILTHNGKFDYKVLKCTCNWEMPIYWDSYVGARLIDENEPSAGLKQQYIDKIDPTQEKYSIDHLFGDIPYALFNPDVFAYYAATDAYMTYKLYEWQLNKFKDPSLKGVFNIFENIEMPLIKVVADMELTGIGIDREYANRLSIKYHKLMDDCLSRLNKELDKYKDAIVKWRLTPEACLKSPNKKGDGFNKSKSEQLEDPIKITSPTQLAILLYDVLKLPALPTKPRGTGVEELTSLYNKTKLPLCSLMLEMRELDKLLNTFIDKLPNDTNPYDDKIHCEFLSLGTDTGRFSSKNPNLQQIPRANIYIKPMFKAPEGHSLVFCDLSAAEVRTSANASGDPDMIKAYCDGKDLYSLIASKIYNNKYEDNLEFYPEGTKIMYEGKEVICGKKTHTNKSGKVRRQDSKSVLIGLIYGRGASSICDQINETRAAKGGDPITKEDAQRLVDNIYKSFPTLKEWMDKTHEFVHKNGYIDDVFGRRRRLPDATLPQYTILTSKTSEFNPLLNCEDRVDNSLIEKYRKKLNEIQYRRDYDKIKEEALKEGVEIHDNQGYIAQAERQSVNFQAQAASSEINKLSMIAIDNNPRLKELGAQLLLTIHDEVCVQCPSENAKEVAEIIPDIMVNVGKDKMKVPLVAEATIVRHWYEDDVLTVLNEYFNKLVKGDESKEILPLSPEEAVNKIIEEHTELLPEQIRGALLEGKDYLWL